MESDRDNRRLSKAMAYQLRHGHDVALLPGGWARVTDLIDVVRPRGGRDALVGAVSGGDKPRFELSNDGALIRARYGHSRDVDLEYLPVRPPDVLYHGTAVATLPVLLAEGIRRQRRRFVHLSDDVTTARQVGARHGPPVVLRVAAGAMAAAGYRFFHAAQGMWLTDAVPADHLTALD
ncbi:RNA 2'-phosphotransferase [soil metagenome]